jgi:tetratricopeptide (TPR) repeat protein
MNVVVTSNSSVRNSLSIAAGIALMAAALPASGSAVKAREEIVTLPTYLAAPADKNPRFYSGRTYQGAKATFYPYPVSDQMTERREDRKYKALALENKYVEFSVLPELGGRIFTAVDKGNNYDFFYRQHVIKPALIGMLGAWISGGVEYNVPHHHRASSFMPVDHTIVEEPDGSKTIWVGETELRHRLRWILGMTLRPDRSYIEMTVKIFNRTAEAQSFLFWINPAVHANTNYQVLFPPSTEWAVQHGKPEFASWPMARQVYGGTDYTRGVDISWWKNHPSPVSFFAWHCEEDFFGGYDHGRQAGVVQISNHHVSPGKKFFEWGNGPEGEMWTKILSDQDGPYLELMAGSYSDNQPDYSWCEPGEVKVFKHYWYPVRQLGGVKNANTEAAVNLEVTNGIANVAFNTTARHGDALVTLKAGERVFFEKELLIAPDEPFAERIPVPAGSPPESVAASLSVDGRELVSYKPTKPEGAPMPEPAKRPIAPKDIATAEELYLTGLRIEQLYSPAFDPVPYYMEALKRDSGDYRANTALASLYCRQGRFDEAEPLLRAAIDRATKNYIRSKDCEAQYYLGVVLRTQGKNRAARDAFYRAIWDQAWQTAGYAALAELACAQGNFNEALELVERSLGAGVLNTRANELRISLFRKQGKQAEATTASKQLLATDPLNPRALHELVLMARARGKKAESEVAELNRTMRGEVTSYLELAIDYASAGLYPEAIDVLETFQGVAIEPNSINPLVLYYLGAYRDKAGQAEKALAEYKKAAEMPADYCFPHQHEAAPILRRAIEANPQDGRALLYLGNLLFDHQPDKAIAAWEKAVQLEPKSGLVQRNLGLARAQAQKDLPGAIACLEKAVTLNADDSRLLYELDVIYEANGTPLEKRLDLLEQRQQTVSKRDDTLTRRVILLTASGKVDAAMRILREHHFHNWEGNSGLHDVYVDACFRSGTLRLRSGKTADALEDFQAALLYPANQEVGKGRREQRVAQSQYLIGVALEKQGNMTNAQAAFTRAAGAREGGTSEVQYYKGLALQRTGKADEAEKLFSSLVRQGEEELSRETEAVDYFAKFGEKRAERLRHAQGHFAAGLGALGLGKKEEAQNRFKKALELHPAHLGAISFLEECTGQ